MRATEGAWIAYESAVKWNPKDKQMCFCCGGKKLYYSDQPIQDSNGDKLGRKPFAMRVAHAIMDLHSRDCFTVSLQGKWGCGKTSIINMILAEIERTSNDSQIRVIRFNPWNFTKSEAKRS